MAADAAALMRVGLIDLTRVGLIVIVVLFGGLNGFGTSGSIISSLLSRREPLVVVALLPETGWWGILLSKGVGRHLEQVHNSH